MMGARTSWDRGERSGRAPLGLVFALFALPATAIGLSELQDEARRQGLGIVRPDGLAFAELPAWADPRWSEEFAELCRNWPAFQAEDTVAFEDFVGAVVQLSFVERVDSYDVVWPDGIALDLELRRPVACVPSGDRFYTVGADGIVLTGSWPEPPRCGPVWLPVIGPLADGQGLFEGVRPGDYLAEPEHLDALATAVSMIEHLTENELELLGCVTIDATRGRAASVEEPGVLLDLEDRRRIVFGRPADTTEPGELAVGAKWAAVSSALAYLATGDPEQDWDLVDVRWDRPELRRRAATPEPAR
jgi:hypothetical protein